jgi:hypothetical protein
MSIKKVVYAYAIQGKSAFAEYKTEEEKRRLIAKYSIFPLAGGYPVLRIELGKITNGVYKKTVVITERKIVVPKI